DPHPRSGTTPDHADRPGRVHRGRAACYIHGWKVLPAHPRLSCPLVAGMADPQAAGDPARACRTQVGRAVGDLERQAREPAPAVGPRMGDDPNSDEEEGLHRTATPDVATGGTGSWDAGIGSRCRISHPDR